MKQVLMKEKHFYLCVNNAATLKVAKKEWNNLYLLPKSKDSYHTPIVLDEGDDVRVNGKVVDVFNF